MKHWHKQIRHSLTILVISILPLTASGEEDRFTLSQTKEVLAINCMVCHGENDPEAGFNLTPLYESSSIESHLEEWNHVLKRVQAGEMPPKNALPIPAQQRSRMAHWLENSIKQAVCGNGIAPGPAPLRRLNKDEYTATIRDLLGVHFNAGSKLPDEGAGGAGFDNAAGTLFLSPIHAERYHQAAKEVLDYAAKDTRARQIIFVEHPGENTSAGEAAITVLRNFASRAYRRPVTPPELDKLMILFYKAFERDDSFESAIFYTLESILISPKFLFLIEQPNTRDMVMPISDYELASRLSYFLWGSMPDDELFEAAEKGRLHRKDVLREQMDRMLKVGKFGRNTPRYLEDRKFHEFAFRFINQWLGIRELGRDARPDRDLFPNYYKRQLEAAMRYEPIYVFQEIIAENLSLLNLIDSDFTFMNRQLSRHYGVDEKVDADRQQMKRVDLPPNSRRGGLITMAGVLTVSSYPHRTSPVLRGKWILETLLGSPPPPPPPDVPELEENTSETEPKTLRERLMQHRQNPVCASCHDRIDPLGFGLENFDAIGRWRKEDAGQLINASGQLPDGRSFNGPEELKMLLMQRKDQFVRHLTVKMLSYALGRGLTLEDQCTVDQIMTRLKQDNYHAQTLIWEIIKSVPFRYRPANESSTIASTP